LLGPKDCNIFIYLVKFIIKFLIFLNNYNVIISDIFKDLKDESMFLKKLKKQFGIFPFHVSFLYILVLN